VPVRIAVERFAHTRSTRPRAQPQRRAHAGANGDALAGHLLAPRATAEQFELFALYQRSRHRDSEMAAMSYADYRGMVEDSAVRTAIVEFRAREGALVAVSLIDRLDDGVSAVYSFYDPAHHRRSLGTWCILWLVEECRREGWRTSISAIGSREPEDGLQGALPGARTPDGRMLAAFVRPASFVE